MGNRIITISRTFGSGGREVGKRLADALECGYYDKELIHAIAEETGFSKEFVEKYSESAMSRGYPIHIARTFMMTQQMPDEAVQIAQTNILRDIAKKGDCVIVGRRSDYILREENPLKVFIYSSSMEQRIARCVAKVPEDGKKSQKEMEKQIRSVDKLRAKYYGYFTDQIWGQMENYNLCIDTSKVSVMKAVEMILLALEG